MTCPGCQRAAEFHGHRPRTLVSLLGDVRCRRAYYHCGRCGSGTFPFDEQVGLTPRGLTPGAQRAVSLAGLVDDGFGEAAVDVLPELTGLRLGESTVRRCTEDAGARLAELRQAGHTFGESTPFDWHKDAQGRTCAYVGVDAVSVPQQAEGGGKAEGRMPYVAVIYNPPPEKPDPPKPAAPQPAPEKAKPAGLPVRGYEPVAETAGSAKALPGQPAAGERPRRKMQARYLAGLYELPRLGIELRKQGAEVGMERADLWIALSDAGSGLEDFLRENFNRADLVVILDFWHPASYLERLALAWHPKDPEQSEELALRWCKTLKHKGGPALLEELRGLELPKGKAVREAYAEAVRYLENHGHRMNYPYYLSQGWHIGSGPVESACKSVVSRRLKGAGMRWREFGTDSVCQLRALFKSGKDQWRAFWERQVN